MLTMPANLRSARGFSLPELMIAVTLLLMISATVTQALLQMTNSQKTIWNRTQLHAGVRSATELLQQEVGQAGRIALPTITCPSSGVVSSPCLTLPVLAGATTATFSSVAGMFVGERLIIDLGTNQETVQISAVNTATKVITISRSVDASDSTVQASFAVAHAIGAKARVYGGFASGIVPPSPGFPNGSTGSVLKLYGDLNSDGSMVYVEYTCDPLPVSGIATTVSPGTGNLYRNVMPFDQATAKVAPNATQILLGSIQTNPGGTACFTYMPNPLPVVNGASYVLDVAITLTVQTQTKDSITNAFQTETKALLNVSPRNVFNVWQLASSGTMNRVQPMPATVTALLP
jgi:prepilin-type N-terminal cleavage/methylation domain-containing protein